MRHCWLHVGTGADRQDGEPSVFGERRVALVQVGLKSVGNPGNC